MAAKGAREDAVGIPVGRSLSARRLRERAALPVLEPHLEVFEVPRSTDVPLTQPYEIRALLGEGAFGQVRHAVRRACGTELAVKTLPLRPAPEEPFADALARHRRIVGHEIRALERVTKAQLDQADGSGPRVAALHEVIECDTTGDVHLVLDLCRGGELFSFISARHRQARARTDPKTGRVLYVDPSDAELPFTEGRMAWLAAEMMKCVKSVHAAGLVHLDVKPENFMYRSKDAAGLCLIDFDMARPLLPHDEAAGHLDARTGTPAYAAPEVLAAQAPTSSAATSPANSPWFCEKSDAWSLGCSLYVLATCALPWQGLDGNGLGMSGGASGLGKPRERKLDTDHGFWQKLNPKCADLIQGLLQFDANDRLSVDDALAHEWIRDFSGTAGTPLAEQPSTLRPQTTTLSGALASDAFDNIVERSDRTTPGVLHGEGVRPADTLVRG